jgi:hypothetical protein
MVVELQCPQVLPDIEIKVFGPQPMMTVSPGERRTIAERHAFAAPLCANVNGSHDSDQTRSQAFGFDPK